MILSKRNKIVAVVIVAGLAATGTVAFAWQASPPSEAEQIATDALELEARRRAVEGVAKPLVSMGKLVRDDDGKVIEVRDYSDHLMLALLRGHRPERFREAALRVDVTFDIGSRLDTALRYRASAGRVIEGDSTATATAIEGEPTDT